MLTHSGIPAGHDVAIRRPILAAPPVCGLAHGQDPVVILLFAIVLSHSNANVMLRFTSDIAIKEFLIPKPEAAKLARCFKATHACSLSRYCS